MKRVKPTLASVCLALVVAAAAGAALALPGDSVAVGNCSLTPLRPIVYFSGGVKVARGAVEVRCAGTALGTLGLKIMEDDVVFDDEVGKRTIEIDWPNGGAYTFFVGGVCRDWDRPGSEELFTEAKLNGITRKSTISYVDC